MENKKLNQEQIIKDFTVQKKKERLGMILVHECCKINIQFPSFLLKWASFEDSFRIAGKSL